MLLNGFAKFDGLKGTSTDGAFDGAPEPCEILSFHHEMMREGWEKRGDALLPPEVTHGQVTILKPIDALSAKLAGACCKGDEILKVEIVCRAPLMDGAKLVEKNMFQVTLNNVVVTRFHYVGDPRIHVFGRGGRSQPIRSRAVLEMGPVEEVELLYRGDISWIYGENDGGDKATPPRI